MICYVIFLSIINLKTVKKKILYASFWPLKLIAGHIADTVSVFNLTVRDGVIC